MCKHSLIKRTLAGLMAAAMVMNTAVSPVYAATPDASSTQESQDAQRIEDALNPGSAPTKATRSQMQERQLKAPRLGATQTIEQFSTQFVYGADNVGGKLVWTPKSNAAGHNFIFRVNYALSGTGEYPADTVHITVPKHILKDRYNNWADVNEIALPSQEEVEAGEADDEIYYAWREDGNNIVIYNYKPISAADNGYVEMSYATEKVTTYYKDMEPSAAFNATIDVDGATRQGDAITVYINTGVSLSSTIKRYPTKYNTWQSWFGTQPADAGDYYYLVWDLETYVNTSSSQPYNLQYTDTVSSTFGNTDLVGYRFSGQAGFSANDTVMNQTLTGRRFDQVLTRLAKADFEDAMAYTVNNNIVAKLTPADGKDPVTTATSSRSFNYVKERFVAPGGYFWAEKDADGVWRDYHDRGYSNGYTELSHLGMKASEYSNFDLADLQEEKIDHISDLDYALYSYANPYYYTVPAGQSHDDPANYGRVNVKHELVDDYISFYDDNNPDAELRQLTSDDFEIDTLAYEIVLRGADFDEEKQQFVSKSIVPADTDVAYVYGKFGSDNTWHLIATENLKTRNVVVDDTYVTAVAPISTGKKLTLADNCVAYKIENSSPYYYTRINAVPNITLKNSDYVKSYIDGKDEIAVKNRGYNVFTDIGGTPVFTKTVADCDFIRITERNSQLDKQIVTATNVMKKRNYVIGWKVVQDENYTVGMSELRPLVQQGGVFYDLIPMGATVDQSTIAVATPDGFLPDSAYSYTIDTNFRDSGRTLLTVRVLEAGDRYTLYYDTVHPWDSIKDYGYGVYNPVAYETGNEDIINGRPDDGGTIRDKVLFNDLDPDSNAPRFLYDDRDYDISAITAAASGLTKKVRNADQTNWYYETTTTVNGTYQYRMRFMNSYTSTAKNLILFDSLENYTVPGGTVSDFHGTPIGLDISQLEEKGIAPVVYISTQPNLDIDAHHDLTDSSVWTKLVNINRASLAPAKAIAIDMRKTGDGDPYVLPAGDSVSAILYMRAPAGANAAGTYPYAYNNIYISDTVMSFGNTADYFIHQDYTAVKFLVTADLKLHKSSTENVNEDVPGIQYRLFGTSDYGTDVDMIKETGSNGTIDFGKIEKGTYVLNEYATNDDWLMDYTQHTVEVTALGKLLIDGTDWTDRTYETADRPRVHGDLSLVKRRENETDGINNTWFRLTGTSDYGNDVAMNGKTDNAGRVKFKNIEKGTYTLVEAQANGNYILNTTKWVVKVDDGGAASVSAPDTAADRDRLYEVGRLGNAYVIFNEPRFWDATIRKIDATTIDNESSQQIWLQGATFTLDGVSDLGTEYHATVTSDANGRVLFTNLEKGSYVLKETVAPTGVDETGKTGTGGNRNYLKDNKEYILHVDNQGNVTVDGLSKNDLGDVKFPNDRALDGRITVTKKWVDVDPANRKIPQLTLSTMEPVHGQNVLRFDANGGKFTNGTGINDTVYSDPVSKVAVVEDESKKRVSHTANISDDGTQNGNYKNSITTNEVITIDGADSLKITITYGGESASYDYVCAWEGSHPDYKANTNSTSSFTDKLGGGKHTDAKNTKTYEIEGDTVTFSFRSDSGGVGDGYGYYAVIIPSMKTEVQDSRLVSGTYEEPKRKGFKFTGWYAEPECENLVSSDGTGIVMNGDKTVYAGWKEVSATLLKGEDFNKKIKTLAGNNNPAYTTPDSKMTAFLPYDGDVDTSSFTENNIISAADSEVPVYAWFDNGTIYWYSDALKVYMNENSGSMFRECNAVTSLDLSGIDTSKVTDMFAIFYNCKSLTSLDVSSFNTSNVTNMVSMFGSCKALTSLDLSGFDTSNVTTMNSMFYGCSGLTSLDISNFDTSKVTTMYDMFNGCNALTSLDLSGFDTINVTTMNSMFYGCSGLTSLDLSGFDTSKVTNMGAMFYRCRGLTSLDVNGFDTSNVTTMAAMFSDCKGLTSLDVSGFDTGKVTDMHAMFCNCSGLTSLDVTGFDTSNVTSIGTMFSGCSGLTSLDVSGFDTSNVTLMNETFYGCNGLTSLDVSGFDTSNVQDMYRMFCGCKALTSLDLSGFNTSNVTRMEDMFSGCSGLTSLDVSGFSTGKVYTMGGMFQGCKKITVLDLSRFDTSKVTKMNGMFNSCSELTTIYASEFWNTDKVTSSGYMFVNCTSLPNFNAGVTDKTNAHYGAGGYLTYKAASTQGARVEDGIEEKLAQVQVAEASSEDSLLVKVVDFFFPPMTVYAAETGTWGTATYELDDDNNLTFTGSGEITKTWPTGLRTKVVSIKCANGVTVTLPEDSRYLFNCTKLTNFDATGFDTSKVTNMQSMFADCSSLTSLDVSGFDTSKVTDMYCMFRGCKALTSLDVSGFDTSKVTDMGAMFNNCKTLTSLDVSGFDTSKVTNMNSMFASCEKLTSLDVSGFDTSNVATMSYMFNGCKGLTSLDVSSFDTSKVTTMESMFSGCNALTSLNVSGFDTSNVTNMASMFSGCSGLTSLDVSGFDTSKVTRMDYMFSDCNALTSLDVSGLDTSKVTTMESMFSGCSGLTSLDVSRFDTSNVKNMGGMFSSCKAITNLDVSNFDTSKVTSMGSMFSNCKVITNLDVSNFDTSKVTNMNGMFMHCDGLTSLDVTRFDTSNVTRMDGMFQGCYALTSLDVSGFDTSNVTTMSYMFDGCSALTSLDVSGFDTSKVTSMSNMFENCSSIANLDVSGFDTSNVIYMTCMFRRCAGLTSLNLSGFDTSNVTSMYEMFAACYNLQKVSFPKKFFMGISSSKFTTTVPWHHVKDINGAKTHDETEYTTAQIMTFSDTTTPQLGGVWKRVDYLPHKDLGDGNYEYYSDDDEWEQDGDTWTYTFKVFDDNLKYYLTEKPIAGYTSPVMTGFEIVDGKNGVKSAVITNTANDVKTGSIKLAKEVSGLDTDEKFIFDITLAGMTGTKIYDGVIFTNGKGRVTLGNGEEKVITGIPENTVYTVIEVPDERFSVTSTNETGTIAADTETEITFINTYIPTIVEPEPPVDITVRKEIAGRFETAGEYHFTAWFEGLEKRKQYTYTGSTFTAADDGTAVVEFTLAKDAEVTFSDIPDGAKYQFTEDAGDYVSAFHVTDTAGLGSVVMTDKENTSRNEELSTEIETANTGEQVKVTFTNTLNKTQPLHIRKAVVGNTSDHAEFYPVTIRIMNLEPGAKYDSTIGRLVADGDGVIEKDTSVSESQGIDFYALPVGAIYEFTEGANHMVASYTVTDANNMEHIANAAQANTVKNKAITTAVETVNEGEDVTVTFRNERRSDLTLRKLTSNETTDRFTFTVTLTGTLPATLNVNNNGTVGTATLTDNKLTITLGKGEYYTIKDLPMDVSYTITETDNPKYRATIDNAGTAVSGATATGNMAEDREVIYTNTVADAKIKVQKQFNKTYSQYGDAVSVFRISGTAHDGTHREWIQTIKYPATEFEITVPVGTYTVEEVNTSRYYPVSVAGVAGDVTVNTTKMTGTVNLTDGNATVKFTNDFTQWEELSHTNEVVNIVPKKASSGN